MCIAHDMPSTTSRKMMNKCFILCIEGTKMILTSKHNTVHKGAALCLDSCRKFEVAPSFRRVRILLALKGTATVMHARANQWHDFFGCT